MLNLLYSILLYSQSKWTIKKGKNDVKDSKGMDIVKCETIKTYLFIC